MRNVATARAMLPRFISFLGSDCAELLTNRAGSNHGVSNRAALLLSFWPHPLPQPLPQHPLVALALQLPGARCRASTQAAIHRGSDRLP